MIRQRCPSCDAKLGIDESLLGKPFRCAACNEKIVIEGESASVEQVTAAEFDEPDSRKRHQETEPNWIATWAKTVWLLVALVAFCGACFYFFIAHREHKRAEAIAAKAQQQADQEVAMAKANDKSMTEQVFREIIARESKQFVDAVNSRNELRMQDAGTGLKKVLATLKDRVVTFENYPNYIQREEIRLDSWCVENSSPVEYKKVIKSIFQKTRTVRPTMSNDYIVIVHATNDATPIEDDSAKSNSPFSNNIFDGNLKLDDATESQLKSLSAETMLKYTGTVDHITTTIQNGYVVYRVFLVKASLN